jgi:hypothetical protein
LNFAKLFEELGKLFIGEAWVLGEVLDVEVVERLLDCLFALVLKHSQRSLLAVAFACEVILVELKWS